MYSFTDVQISVTQKTSWAVVIYCKNKLLYKLCVALVTQ